MKPVLLFLFAQLFWFTSFSQTPSSFQNLTTNSNDKRALAPNSLWVGAQVGYKFTGTGDFSDNLLVSGRILYDIPLVNSVIKLPVMGNISSLRDAYSSNPNTSIDSIKAKASDLLQSNQGINIGLYPYWEAVSSNNILLTVFASASWKLNSFKTSKADSASQTTDIGQGRLAAGAEVSIGSRGDGKYPLTISITPTLTLFNAQKYETVFHEKRSSIFSVELTGVIPINSGIGVLAEGILASHPISTFRLGIIIAGKK